MTLLTKQRIEKYQKEPLYDIFHKITPPKKDDDRLIVRPIKVNKHSTKDNNVAPSTGIKTKQTASQSTDNQTSIESTNHVEVSPKNESSNRSSQSYGGPNLVLNKTQTHESSQFVPTNSKSETIPTNIDNNHSEHIRSTHQIKQNTDKTIVQTPPPPQPRNKANLLDDVLGSMTTKKAPEHQNSQIYEQIRNAANDKDWLLKTHEMDLAFKSDLQKLSIKRLTVYDCQDSQESYIPFNSLLFNMLGSVIIGKDQFIIFIFRNGKNISIAPSSWFSEDKSETINAGFNFYYKNINFTKLVESLKVMSVNINSTDKYTEFWLKYMPIVQN